MNKQHIYLFSYIVERSSYGFVTWGFKNKNITNKNLNEVITDIEKRNGLKISILSVSYLGYMSKEEFEKE